MRTYKLFNLLFAIVFAASFTVIPYMVVAQESLNPFIGASPNQGYVYGFQWPNGDLVHMIVQRGGATIYEANATVGPCGLGSPALGPCGSNDVYFDISDQLTGTPPVILQGGDVISLIDGAISRSMTVSVLQASGIDINAGTLSGIADPGQTVGVIVGSPQNISAIPDTNGNWTAVLGSQYTQLGMGGGLVQCDGNNNCTVQGWSVPQPYIAADANKRSIQARERDWLPLALWTVGTSLTLTIDDPSNGVGVDYSATAYMQPNSTSENYAAFADFGWPEMGLQPGFVVTVSGPQVTRTLVITLDVTDINVQADTVTGIAEAGARVRVCANVLNDCIARYVMADDSGSWLADYRNPGSQPDEQQTVDIMPGMDFSVSEMDLDGDEYIYHWSALLPPRFMLNVNNDGSWCGVDAWNWPIDSRVTLTVDDPNASQNPVYTETQTMGVPNYPGSIFSHAMYMQDCSFEGHPGFVITLSDGTKIKSMKVPLLKITGYDFANDTISGHSDPFTTLSVPISAADGSEYAERTVATGANGNWLADFAVSNGPDEFTHDVRPGDNVEPQFFDADGDHVVLRNWFVPNPRLKVELTDNRIDGFEWTDDSSITLTIDDPATAQIPDFSSTQTAQVISEDPEQAVVSFDPGSLTLRPGLLVTMTDGTTTKIHTIPQFSWTAIDYAADVISGMAEPEVDTYIWAFDENGVAVRHFLPNVDRSWIASFAVPGNEDWETILDIHSGMSGGMCQKDDDLDETIRRWADINMALNQPPVITSITAPISPVQLGQDINAAVTFNDPDVGGTHTITWDWGDGTTTIAPASVPSVTTSHIYASTGVYTVSATITDVVGASDTETFQYIVIYDPNGGFVTGGGWINSPAGAYTVDLTLTGKATFGFVSKYQKGANVPTGNTEFQFKVADLNFKSTSYDWMVIAGSKAQYKGTGTINGLGEYKFMLIAIDGTPDKFRIKIWDKVTGGIVYDNMYGWADTADPTTVLGGGSIVIHKEK